MERMSVTKILRLSYFLLVLGTMLMMGIYCLPSLLNSDNVHLESVISWTARLLSEDTDVVQSMVKGEFSFELTERMDSIKGEQEFIDYVVFADVDSVRLYHPDHSLIGEKFTGGDENLILTGSEPYISTARGEHSVQKRAFHSIMDESGKILGFVMVSASMTNIYRQRLRICVRFALVFLIVMAAGFLLAYWIAGKIRDILLGHDPAAFARMFLLREDLLDNLDEGLAAVSAEGEVLYSNKAASVFLSEDAQDLTASTNKKASGSVPQSHRLRPDSTLFQYAMECVDTGTQASGLLAEASGTSLLVSTMPLPSRLRSKAVARTTEKDEGTVLLIMRDRTDFVRMAEQMTGMNHVLEALRANTHEYLNRLHVISGLLQAGANEEAVQFIHGITSETEANYQTIVRQIQNRTVAALLLGKFSRARELDISFSIRRDSCLEVHNLYLSTREIVTIVGNLVENAFEAINGQPEMRQAEIFIGSDDEGLTIVVDDTGRGMTKEQIEMIYQKQYTTKGEGHGIGLRLIQEIVRKHSGYFEIESELGEGSSFTVTFSKKCENTQN